MKRILCFGDSNTWGAIPGSSERHPEEVRWTGILQRELGSDYRVIEEGYNGRASVFYDHIEERLSGIDYFRPCLESQSPLDLVILMLGTNDLKPQFGVDAMSVAYGMQAYLRALDVVPMAGERPEVLLVAPVHVDPSYANDPSFLGIFGPRADERSAEYGPAYFSFAKEHGIHFLDASQYAKASKVDGVHMDAEGHAALAVAFVEKVREILG